MSFCCLQSLSSIWPSLMEHSLQRPVTIGNGLKTNISTIRLEENSIGISSRFPVIRSRTFGSSSAGYPVFGFAPPVLAALFDFQKFDFVHEHSVRRDEILDASLPIPKTRADFAFRLPPRRMPSIL